MQIRYMEHTILLGILRICASDDYFTAVTVDAEFIVGAGRFVLQLEFGDAQSNRMTDSDGGSEIQLPAMVI